MGTRTSHVNAIIATVAGVCAMGASPVTTTAPSTQPASYVARRVETPPLVDGQLDDAAWDATQWTSPFVDLAGRSEHPPKVSTRGKVTWDDANLYIAAELTDPLIWGTMTKHDSPLFREDAFEVFIDPDGDGRDYLELQVSARCTTWDLKMSRPYHENGKADSSFEIEGLRSAVAVDGTLNQHEDVDRSWSVELTIPWAALAELSDRPLPAPRSMRSFRMNFVRVDRPPGPPGGVAAAADGAAEYSAWSPAGARNAHKPETWGAVRFIEARLESSRIGPATLRK